MSPFEFDTWYDLKALAVKDVPQRGSKGFVYVLRQRSTKRVLYIGGTADLRRSLFASYIGGVGGPTTERVHELLFAEGAIADTDVAWKEVVDHDLEEQRLRQAHLEQEGELPPWNKPL
jgi:predicted GIY-YIG superfamily endonuclease